MITAIAPVNSQKKSRQNFGIKLKINENLTGILQKANFSTKKLSEVDSCICDLISLTEKSSTDDTSLYELSVNGLTPKGKLDFKLKALNSEYQNKADILEKQNKKHMFGLGLSNVIELLKTAINDENKFNNLKYNVDRSQNIKKTTPIS